MSHFDAPNIMLGDNMPMRHLRQPQLNRSLRIALSTVDLYLRILMFRTIGLVVVLVWELFSQQILIKIDVIVVIFAEGRDDR
jgi:hypothetical protein